jgi:hypothetical protein
MNAMRVLLDSSIDYAGLFPPAALDMRAAAANYARYRNGESAWALGRFILPANRLLELEAVAEEYLPLNPAVQPWRLSVLAGPELGTDLDLVAEFNRRHSSAGSRAARIDTIEVKASSVGVVEDTMQQVPRQLQVYIEIPVREDPRELVTAIARLGGRAKVRTGGVTREAFPRTADLVRFISACIRAQVAFKATAGLHHALRAEYRLNYEPDSATGVMFGFLNLFLAAAFLRAGMNDEDAGRILEETSPDAFSINDGIRWRDHRLGQDALRGAREAVITSFGSCSFTEPISELQALHLLEPRVQQA